MKTPHYGFIFKSAKHLIMCFSLLSFAITANAVETTKPPVPVEGRLSRYRFCRIKQSHGLLDSSIFRAQSINHCHYR